MCAQWKLNPPFAMMKNICKLSMYQNKFGYEDVLSMLSE